MERLFGFCLVLYILYLLVTNSLLTAPVWGTAGFCSLLTGAFLAVARAFYIRSPRQLRRVFRISRDGISFQHAIAHDQLDSVIRPRLLAALSAVPGFYFVYNTLPSAFSTLTAGKSASDEVPIVLGGAVMSLVSVGGAAVLTFVMVQGLALAQIRRSDAALEQNRTALSELLDAEQRLRDLATLLNVPWPPGFTDSLDQPNSPEALRILREVTATKRSLKAAMAKTMADIEMLGQARESHLATVAKLRETSQFVNHAHAISFRYELEAIHEAVLSSDLAALLLNRDLPRFKDIHSDFVRDLERITKEAVNSTSQSSSRSHPAPSDLDLACQFLEITPEMTEEEMKRQYRRLAQLYHPDRQPQNLSGLADRRFKRLQEAWHVLKEHTGIT